MFKTLFKNTLQHQMVQPSNSENTILMDIYPAKQNPQQKHQFLQEKLDDYQMQKQFEKLRDQIDADPFAPIK